MLLWYLVTPSQLILCKKHLLPNTMLVEKYTDMIVLLIYSNW